MAPAVVSERHTPEASGRAHKIAWPWRDCFIMPLLVVLTTGMVLGIGEFIARRLFPASKSTLARCLVLNDLASGSRGVPNSVCYYKIPEEDSLVEYRFNSCGHRAGMECSPKAAGVYRIVTVGSSMVFGYHTPWKQTFVALLGDELSDRLRRRIEVYNEGIYWGTPRRLALDYREVANAQPDMILWPITPIDVERAGDLQMLGGVADGASSTKSPRNPLGRIWQMFLSKFEAKSRIPVMLRHYLYESREQYLDHFLVPGPSTDFLKTPPSSQWQQSLQTFDLYFKQVESQARIAGVPLVVTVLPNRAQASLISKAEWPAGYDPYRFGDQLRAIVTRDGATYFDILHDFERVPNPEEDYLPVDGHPNIAGNAKFAEFISREITSGAVPQLTSTQK